MQRMNRNDILRQYDSAVAKLRSIVELVVGAALGNGRSGRAEIAAASRSAPVARVAKRSAKAVGRRGLSFQRRQADAQVLQQKIVERLTKSESASTADLVRFSRATPNQVRFVLARLKAARKVSLTGAGRSARWHAAETRNSKTTG